VVIVTQKRAGRLLVAFVGALTTVLAAQAARADDIGALVIRTLREFGHTITLTDRSGTFPGGIAASSTATYTGQQLDFGMVSLTLGSVTNPSTLAFSFEAAKRLGPQAEFHVQTLGNPLEYNLDVNTGFQKFNAVGSADMNANMVINPLGFYDFDVFISNRGTFTSSGVLSEEDGTLDFDAGPINVSGNIFVDALALITEPLFSAAGQENPFTQFSGRATQESVLTEIVNSLKDKVDAGQALTDKDMADLVDATVLAAVFGLPMPDTSFLNDADVQGVELEPGEAGLLLNGTATASVPEPTPLVLLCSGTAVWFAARRRTRMTK
jgi:hypothetical protein